jgi:hypothetical protein
MSISLDLTNLGKKKKKEFESSPRRNVFIKRKIFVDKYGK